MPNTKQVDKLVAQAQADISHLMAGLSGGQLSADQWHQGMEDLLTEVHLAAYLVASGAQDAPDLVDSPIGQYIADQLDYLDQWAADLDPEDPRNDGRGAMYGSAVRGAYSLGDTDGWPLPTHPGEGTDCLTNCKCEWDIVVIDAAGGDADAFWERHAQDSCPTCVERAGKYYPLRIRGGAIV
jgi:hypothetical protein